MPSPPDLSLREARRGRRSTNLYHLGFDPGWPDETVGSLRRRLRLDA